MAESIAYQGTRTLDNGASGYGPVAVSAANPLPVSAGVSEPLVFTPFRGDAIGGGSVNGAFTTNDDGTRTGSFLSVAASASWATSANLSFWFDGNVFGLRFAKATNPPIGVMIDGIAYEVPYGLRVNPRTQASATGALTEEVILAAGLGDGPHYVEMQFPASTVAARTWNIMGSLVEARCNPPPPPRGTHLDNASTALTTSWQTVTPTSLASYGIAGVHFVNTTASAITVSIRYSSGNGAFWSRSVPANDTLDYTPPGGRPIYHSIDLTASATGVNAFLGGLN